MRRDFCVQRYKKVITGCMSAILVLAAVAPSRPVEGRPSVAGVAAFWDPKRRPDKPDVKALRQIRFLTEDDYPPFNFTGSSGQLEGFNVDMARAVCAELGVPCLIQSRRWDTIVAALEAGQGDVIAASLAPTPEARARLLFTEPYYRTPARFSVRRDKPLDAVSPAVLKDKTVAVVGGTAHEAYLKRFFPDARLQPKASEGEVLEALRKGEVDLSFGDGIATAFWLNGAASQACCRFAGGPFLESAFFGEGVGMALRPGDLRLKGAIDFALFRLWEKGTYADLARRWFPVSPYGAGG
jgi:polar amino acid transport system substrate-binding protein